MRALAGALSAAPLGFAAGALAGGRYVVVEGGSTGVAILILALFGAVLAAVVMALATAFLPPKTARISTIVAGGFSFAVLVYMVQDFIADRIEQGRAFDAAYAEVPSFELILESTDRQRRPFARLTFETDRQTDSRDYEALRPGQWLCRGSGRRQHKLALYSAILAARQDTIAPAGPCNRRASWRLDGEQAVAGRCADEGLGFAALFQAADDMVESTERKASCRRASDVQSRRGAANPEA
ncbi:MAG: hypothetical protein OXK76_13275 [Gammaproteobacteria bacterium]|nr:hypothetical protein [Gammaproteobacteria bacterium]